MVFEIKIETGETYSIEENSVVDFCRRIRSFGFAVVSVTPLV